MDHLRYKFLNFWDKSMCGLDNKYKFTASTLQVRAATPVACAVPLTVWDYAAMQTRGLAFKRVHSMRCTLPCNDAAQFSAAVHTARCIVAGPFCGIRWPFAQHP